jgi:hypothetical protein
MPPLRSILFAVPTLLLAILSSTPITPTVAVASPAPLPMPLRAADYGASSMLGIPSMKATVRSVQGTNYTVHHSASGHITSVHGKKYRTHAKLPRIHRSNRRDDAERMQSMHEQLRSHSNDMVTSARRMSTFKPPLCSISPDNCSRRDGQSVIDARLKFYVSTKCCR